MAQQPTMSDDHGQMQQNLGRVTIPNKSNDQNALPQGDAGILSENHTLGCDCPKHELSNLALTQPSRVSQQSTDVDIAKQQQLEVSEAIHRGLKELGVELSNSEADQIATNYTGMMPMERFLEETCRFAEAVANLGGQDGKNDEGQKG